MNIYKRVKSHFSNNKAGKQKQDFLREIYSISYKECATDLMAHILESTEIRRLWPIHNRSQRGYLPKFGLFTYEDQQGYTRMCIEKNKNHYKPVYTFNTLTEGHLWLRKLIDEFGLCPRLCNTAKEADCENGTLADGCTGSCAATNNSLLYNKKATEAVLWMQQHLPTFALVDKGNSTTNESCILIKKGSFYGMGYIKDRSLLSDLVVLEQQLEPLQDNDYIRNLVYKHAAEWPAKCVAI